MTFAASGLSALYWVGEMRTIEPRITVILSSQPERQNATDIGEHTVPLVELQVRLLKVTLHVLPQQPETCEPGEERPGNVSQRIRHEIEDPLTR